MSTVIGLSFGNTSSAIAYIKEGKVEVIANADGDRAIPSMLSYAHGDEYHGGQAKQQLVRNAENTVGFFRDFLGRKFSEIDAWACSRSAKPVSAADGSVSFQVAGEEISVDEITRRHLAQLRSAAVDYIGKDIDGAVLAVPETASEAQIAQLKKLSGEAGLPVIQVVKEQSAAALAHVSRPDLRDGGDRVIVVTDFAGTRSDGAVIAYNGGIMTTLATLSNTKLGGRLLDDKLVTYLAQEFEKQTSAAIDFAKDTRAVAKLAAEAEAIKKTLSNSTTTQFGIESLSQGIDFSGSLTRLKLELIGRDLFSQFGAFVKELVAKSGLDLLDIDEVLLVGGASWSPKVSSVVRGIFDDNERVVVRSPLNDPKAVDPDELIARGCAIQGSLVAGMDTEEITLATSDAKVVTGRELAKGLGVLVGDEVVPVLHAHTLVPIRRSIDFEASGPSLIRIVEIDTEIRTETHKPEPKEKTEDDDESDWSDDDEEYETRERVLKAGATVAELAITATSKVTLSIGVTRDLRLQVSARSGNETVSGAI